MLFYRPFIFFIVLSFGLVARADSGPSARKIGPVEVGYVESMQVSPDGRFLSVLSLPGEKGSNCIVIDRQTHQSTLLSASSRMEPVCFSRDGRRLWVWGLHLDEPLPELHLQPRDREFLALYDLRRRCYVRAFFSQSEEAEVPSDGALSRDGKTLIFASQDGFVCGFDTRSGRVKWRRARRQDDEMASMSFNNDGSKIIRASQQYEEAMEVVAARSGRVLSTLRLRSLRPEKPESDLANARFAPRGSMAAVLQRDRRKWAFFDSRSGKIKWQLSDPSVSGDDTLSWHWSPDARFVGVSTSKLFELRDARTGRILRRCTAMGGSVFSFAPDNRRIYAFQANETGFGADTELWQWRLFPTPRQRRADARLMRRLRASEARFAVSPRHINESLIIAARRGDPKRVAMLLDHGANIEARDRHKMTALATVAFGLGVYGGPHRFTDCARYLLARGADVNTRNNEGSTPLAVAAMKNAQITKLLLEQGGEQSQADLNKALLSATGFPQPLIVKMILERGADANARDSDGQTPLMKAANWGWAYGVMDKSDRKSAVSMIHALLAHGANFNARNKNGHTALDNAYDPVVKAALQKAAAKP